MLLICNPIAWRQRQEDCHKLESSLVYIGVPYRRILHRPLLKQRNVGREREGVREGENEEKKCGQ